MQRGLHPGSHPEITQQEPPTHNFHLGYLGNVTTATQPAPLQFAPHQPAESTFPTPESRDPPNPPPHQQGIQTMKRLSSQTHQHTEPKRKKTKEEDSDEDSEEDTEED